MAPTPREPSTCIDCSRKFSRGSRARRLCRTCLERRQRRGITLPDIICTDCGVVVQPRRGLRGESRCPDCQDTRDRDLKNTRARERRRTDPEYRAKANAASEAWGRTKEGRRREYAGRWRQKLAPEYADMRVEHMEAMCEAQGNRCAICGCDIEFSPRTGQSANLDHCHRSGRIRGWLCSPCNRGLGAFYDDPDMLDKAANYLRERAGGIPLPNL